MRVTPSTPVRRTGIISVTIAALLWGTGGLTGTVLGRVTHLSPLAVATDRLLSGGILIVACLAATGRRLPTGRAAWTRIVAVGVLSALFQGAYFASITATSVSIATLVTIGTVPVLVVLAERLTGRRRIDRRTAGTVLLAVTGLALLIGLPTSGFSATALLASAGLAVLAAAGFATNTLLNTTAVPGLDALTTTGAGFTLGGLLLAPLALAGGGLAFHPTAAGIGLLLALGIGPTAVAYTLYFRGLRTAGAGTAAVLTLLEPLTGTVLSTLLLGDRLTGPGVLGAVLLAIAMILAATDRR